MLNENLFEELPSRTVTYPGSNRLQMKIIHLKDFNECLPRPICHAMLM